MRVFNAICFGAQHCVGYHLVPGDIGGGDAYGRDLQNHVNSMEECKEERVCAWQCCYPSRILRIAGLGHSIDFIYIHAGTPCCCPA
eukprot:4093605-Amphidinium_carterae.1